MPKDEDYTDSEIETRAQRQLEDLEEAKKWAGRGELDEAERIYKQVSDTRSALRLLMERNGIIAKGG
jgi:soluble cytochrome b562